MTTKNNKFIEFLPNVITASRIIASLLLCFFPPTSASFIVFYIWCGLSDMADGFLARKLNCKTHLGSLLDSIADLAFTACISVKLIPLIDFSLWLIIWLCFIVILRVAALVICLVRFKRLGMLHTFTNKAAGLLIFALFLPFCLLSWQWCGIAGCTVASIAAGEELLRMSFSKEFLVVE